jgi:hypothetical protein
MGPGEGPEAGRLAGARDEARLLVLEDEPIILELLSGSLRFAGFDVVTASTGPHGSMYWRAEMTALLPRSGELRDGGCGGI